MKMNLGQWWLFEATPIIAIVFDCFIFYLCIKTLYHKALE